MSPRCRHTALVLLGATALTVPGCGDGADSGSAGSGYGGDGVQTTGEPTTTTTAEATTTAQDVGGSADSGSGQTVDVVETDFAIDPAKPTAKAGQVTFAITNAGDTVHNLEVEGNGVDEVSEDVAAGERTELTVDIEPGSYKLYCAIPGHEELGMTGELTVK